MFCLRKGRYVTSGARPKQHLVHFTLIIREDEVQKDSNDGGNNERGLDNQVETLFKSLQVNVGPAVVEYLIEPRWGDDVDESDTESDCQDETIPPRKLDHSQDSNTCHHDCAVEKDLHPAKN